MHFCVWVCHVSQIRTHLHGRPGFNGSWSDHWYCNYRVHFSRQTAKELHANCLDSKIKNKKNTQQVLFSLFKSLLYYYFLFCWVRDSVAFWASGFPKSPTRWCRQCTWLNQWPFKVFVLKTLTERTALNHNGRGACHFAIWEESSLRHSTLFSQCSNLVESLLLLIIHKKKIFKIINFLQAYCLENAFTKFWKIFCLSLC